MNPAILKILVAGQGAREHALARALARSPSVREVLVAPGNPGTYAEPKTRNIPEVATVDALTACAVAESVDLVVIGPEALLAAGLADALALAGIPVFGPTRAATRIESSKAFARQLLRDAGVPGPRFATFTSLPDALEYVRGVDLEIVVKASGLAGGKGVLLPNTRADAEAAVLLLMRDRAFGDAGAEIVIEERLEGPELSLLAFCDGRRYALLPPAQDHKRLLAGDLGPNTGGMGACAPATLLDPGDLPALGDALIQPILDALAARGTPFVGALYLGLILTPQGVRVLECNARLGDPEAQVVLPLLSDDLASLMLACARGTLQGPAVLSTHPGAVAAIVLAVEGYPAAPRLGDPIRGIQGAARHADVLHAGTRRSPDGALTTAGGRVLSLVVHASTHAEALRRAYTAADLVTFEGRTLRRDIGHQLLNPPPRALLTYRDAGVDIDASHEALRRARPAIEATYTPQVLTHPSAFAGALDITALAALHQPTLVATTDGVGTKTRLAVELDDLSGLGADLVHHCVNDLIVQGARPLFFLDYIAANHLDPATTSAILQSIADACAALHIPLLGGELAELPDVYRDGALELVGTLVGAAPRAHLYDGAHAQPGDPVLAFASSGLHTNGYTLARRALDGLDLRAVHPALGEPLGQALLRPHRCYLPHLEALKAAGVELRTAAHITGGGLLDNPARLLPPHLAVHLWTDAWTPPPLFQLIARLGPVAPLEMARTFNLGLGFLVVVPRAQLDAARAALPEAILVGQLAPRAEGAPAVELRPAL